LDAYRTEEGEDEGFDYNDETAQNSPEEQGSQVDSDSDTNKRI
jgi:hypothetical protein